MTATGGRRRTFLGGLNVRARWGRQQRFNATVPLALLRADAERLDLRCVPPLHRLPGRAMARDEVAECFRVRPVPPFVFGVGVELRTGEVAYFWTLRPRAVLRALGGLGYPVATGSRPVPLKRAFGLAP